MQPLRILIAEDSPADAELILRELRRSGFEPEWERVDTESDYLERLHSGVEIVLSDYEMPQFSGPRALELLHQSGLDIPFIIISGTIGEDIAVAVMKLGASDYLLKDRLARLGLAVSHGLEEARLRAERKHAEESLLVSQTTMATAQQIAHFGSWEMEMTNPDGIDANGLHWSDEMFRIAGYEPGAVEVTNELFFRLVHPDDHAAIRQAVAAAIREHGRYSIVHRMRRPDGVERIVRETAQIFYDEKTGMPAKMIGTAHDITEQRKMDEHLKLLETCVARLNDIVVITEAEPRDEPGPAILFVNDAFILRTGYTRAEVIGRSPRFLQGPKTCGTELKRIRDAMQHWMPVRAELINYTKSGEEFWIELDIVPVANADGTFTHWVGVARDSTARKKAEEAVKESEARTRILIQASNIGLWEWNLATNEVFFSPEWKSQLGYTDSELPNQFEEWETRIHPEDRATTLAAVKDYLEGRRPDYEVEFRLRHKSGSWRWILTRAKMTVDATGNPLQIMGCHIDITELKRSGERFHRLVESNAQGVFFWNKDGSITDANDAFLNLTGYSREDLDAGTMNWIAMTPPQYEHMTRHCLEEIATRGVCAPYEKEYLRKDGSRVPVIIGAAAFDDSPTEGVCFTVDLTERKKLEQQFLRAQRMESIGTLAAGIAHDLNNILAPIMMSVPMLRRELPAAECQEIITTIEMSAERGAQIVKQVLTFGRGLEGEKRPVKVDGLIGEIVKIIHGTFPKDITLEQRIAPGLWPVMGDATQIHQILLNLCINARDAMPEGGKLRLCARNLEIDASYASMMPGTEAGPYVILEVGDTGSGIPPEIIERIFDPFFTTKPVGQGTGLGLSTVLGIVKSHGGHVSVSSDPGKGTNFQVYLPAIAVHDKIPGTFQSDSDSDPAKGHGQTILVVDDEDAVRGTVRNVLHAQGYRVLQAADGTEALAVFAKHSSEIAVVLTDLMMPFMNGVALIRALRAMSPETPIIASTGLGKKAQFAELDSMNIKTILNKPYRAKALLHAIHEALHPSAIPPSS